MTNVVERHVRRLAKHRGVTAKQAEATLAYCAERIDPLADYLAHVIEASGEELVCDEAAFWRRIEAVAARAAAWAEEQGNGFGIAWGQVRFQDALEEHAAVA